MVATELYQSNNLLSNSTELRKNEDIAIPNLIQIQQKSFEWFKNEGLKELFEEISPIQDYAGGRFELNLLLLPAANKIRQKLIVLSYIIFI